MLGAGTAFLLYWLYLLTYSSWAPQVFPTLRMLLRRSPFEREGVFAAISPESWPLLALGLLCLTLGLLPRRNKP